MQQCLLQKPEDTLHVGGRQDVTHSIVWVRASDNGFCNSLFRPGSAHRHSVPPNHIRVVILTNVEQSERPSSPFKQGPKRANHRWYLRYGDLPEKALERTMATLRQTTHTQGRLRHHPE